MPADAGRRRPSPRLLGIAGLVAPGCWWLGADVWHALAFGGVLVILATLNTGGASGAPDEAAQWDGAGRLSRAGSRGDVAELGRALRGERGRVTGAAVTRVSQLAERRLAARGVSLTDPAQRPAVEALIGRRNRRILTPTRRRRPPRLRALVTCLDALDALDAPEAR